MRQPSPVLVNPVFPGQMPVTRVPGSVLLVQMLLDGSSARITSARVALPCSDS